MSFANLKKNRSKSLDKLSSQLDKMASKGYSDPMKEKYWTPTKDAAGNGFAIIRFLPAPDTEDMPFVRIWDHGFQGPGGWYIEKSLSTLQQDDPLGKYNSQLWNSGVDADKEQARKQKRRLKYHANILIIKDSANPDMEGRVMLYAFGKKIFDKLNDLMNPQFEDETPVNPFDFWEGANFKLKIRQFEGYPNYDKSEFDDASELVEGNDEKLETIFSQLNSLQELIAVDQFKTYAELEAKLHRVLGISGESTYDSGSKAEDIDEDLNMGNLAKSKDETTSKEAESKSEPETGYSDDDDDELAMFKDLVSD